MQAAEWERERVSAWTRQRILLSWCTVTLSAALIALTSCAYLPATVPRLAPPTTQPHLVALDTAECRALLHDDAPVTSLQQAAARGVGHLQRLPLDRSLTALDHRVTVEIGRAHV
jgi:hypothetical protein